MHSEPGRRIRLDDAAAGFVNGPGHSRDDEFDARHVEAYDPSGAARSHGVVGVDVVRAVHGGSAGREVRRVAQIDYFAERRHALRRQPRSGEHAEHVVVELGSRHEILVAVAATWILVQGLDQSRNGAVAVASDMRRHALGHRDQFAVHDRDAMVASLEVLLDDHLPAVAHRLHKGLFDRYRLGEIDRHAAAVIAVERLHHHRVSDALRRTNRILDSAHHVAPRHRQPGIRQKSLGQILVVDGWHRQHPRPLAERASAAEDAKG